MPYKVAFTYAGGHSKTIPELDDAQANELLTAQNTQLAAHIVHLGEKQKLIVNFRQVCALLITDVTPVPEPEPEPEPEPTPVDEPTPEPEPTEPEPAPVEPTSEAPVDEPTPEPEAPTEEPAPEAPAEPAPEEPEEDTRTVPQLKEALNAAGVAYDSSDRKADLLELAKTNKV